MAMVCRCVDFALGKSQISNIDLLGSEFPYITNQMYDEKFIVGFAGHTPTDGHERNESRTTGGSQGQAIMDFAKIRN